MEMSIEDGLKNSRCKGRSDKVEEDAVRLVEQV